MNAVEDCVYLMNAYPDRLPVLGSSVLCVNVLHDRTKGLTPCVGTPETLLILLIPLIIPLCPCGALRTGNWPIYHMCVR